MPLVAIVYFSATGATAALAEAVREGAADLADTALHRISGREIVEGRFRNAAALELIDRADAAIFGTPTFMGGPAAEFKAFADASSDRWASQTWADRIAAGFTCGNQPNGDQSHTLVYLSVLAAQHGMIWCGLDIATGEDASGLNPLGCNTGVAARALEGRPSAADLATARHLGRRVARLAGAAQRRTNRVSIT